MEYCAHEVTANIVKKYGMLEQLKEKFEMQSNHGRFPAQVTTCEWIESFVVAK